MTRTPVLDLQAARTERQRLRGEGRAVVFTNGCFDLLHAGHVRLLEEARAQGDFLIVGLNSDRSVREIKGASRPLVGEADRAALLAALDAVDAVVVYDDPTPFRVIETLLPDVLVKGADWAEDQIIGRDAVLGAGGRVVRIGLLPDHSTTALCERLQRP